MYIRLNVLLTVGMYVCMLIRAQSTTAVRSSTVALESDAMDATLPPASSGSIRIYGILLVENKHPHNVCSF